MDKLTRLTARMEIEDALGRYARAIDRRNWPALRSCFHEDATDEHGEFRGNVEEFIAWVSERHANIPFAAHFLGNCLIEFVDDRTAIVETYFIAMQRRASGSNAQAEGQATEVDAEVIGRYVDRFELRSGAWRIAKRRVAYDSSRTKPSTHRPRKVGTLGKRDMSDAIFACYEQAGVKAR